MSSTINLLLTIDLPPDTSAAQVRNWIASALRADSMYFRAEDGRLLKSSRIVRQVRIDKPRHSSSKKELPYE